MTFEERKKKEHDYIRHPHAPPVVYYLTTRINLLLSALVAQNGFQNLMQLYVGLSEEQTSRNDGTLSWILFPFVT